MRTHAQTLIHLHVDTHECTRIQSYTHAGTHVHRHTRVHVIIHTCVHTNTRTQPCVHTLCMHTYTHTLIHTRMGTHGHSTHTLSHIYVHTRAHMDKGMHIPSDIYTHVCTHPWSLPPPERLLSLRDRAHPSFSSVGGTCLGRMGGCNRSIAFVQDLVWGPHG